MSELKPCPFCGGEARIYMNDSDLDNIMWYCMCTNDRGCNVMPITLDQYSKEEAAAAWNTRHVEPAIRCHDCEHFKRTPPRRVRPDALRMREFVDAHRQGRTWKELREMLAHEGMYYKDANSLCHSYYDVSKRHDTARCLKFGTNDPDGFCAWGERKVEG